jgi:caffeoyl-CoA O-methyltransferase
MPNIAYPTPAKDSFTSDSVSFVYNGVAGCELLRVNDALATVEEMASCNPAQAAFDIVFVDADKTRLIEYVNALVGNDRVLKRGGLILVDNVLWKGLVLDAARGGGYDPSTGGDDGPSEDEEMLGRNRRARKLANKMHRFNTAVVRDERVEVLMMNVRDGLSLIRKR